MTLEQITAANVTFETIAATANPAYHNSVDWYRTGWYTSFSSSRGSRW